MSEYADAIIFIDRHEAKVFHFSANDDVKLAFTHTSAARRHHQADHEDRTEHAVDDEFMLSIVRSLDNTTYTLITGPGNSKYELQSYMHRHRPELAARICGIEALDDATDGGILGLVRQFFRTRAHRHATSPDPSYRHNDVPSKH